MFNSETSMLPAKQPEKIDSQEDHFRDDSQLLDLHEAELIETEDLEHDRKTLSEE